MISVRLIHMTIALSLAFNPFAGHYAWAQDGDYSDDSFSDSGGGDDGGYSQPDAPPPGWSTGPSYDLPGSYQGDPSYGPPSNTATLDMGGDATGTDPGNNNQGPSSADASDSAAQAYQAAAS